MAKRFVACCLFLLAFAMVPQFAIGQAVYGNIIGTVTDQSGAAVPNAKVTVTDVRKGTSDTFTTNADGNYSATHLIPDDYKVRIEAPGFKSVDSPALTVNADASARFDAKMDVGQVSESVEVTSEAPQLKTDRADVNVTFNERYVQDLPLINRNFQSILLDSPGTQKLVGWNHAATENPQGSQQIFVNGQHFSGTGYELDGTDNQDPILGIIVINPNPDAVTEAKVNEQNYYDAEFGKAIAGLMAVQTRSGSNSLHGSGFWFRRTDATEARDPFTQYKPDAITGRYIPKDRWNQFGGTIGGPVIKNKLFFFADYQGTRQASGVTNLLTVPTAQVVKSCTGSGDGSGYCNLSSYVPFFGNGVAGDPSTLIYDPNTGDLNAGTGRTPFCGPAGCATQPDWIPLNRISPVAQKILSMFPAPSSAAITNNFIASGNGPFQANNFDTRIDWDAAPTVNVFGRFSVARFKLGGIGSFGPLGGVGTGLGGLNGTSVNHDYSLSSGVTKTFSSTLLADFRFGWFKYNPVSNKVDAGQDTAKALGIAGMNMGDFFTSGLPSFFGTGVISNFGDGLNPARCNCPLVESENQFQFVNNWTKMKGNHQIKWGADIRYALNLRVPSDANRTGEISFNDGTTSNGGVGGNGFASMLLGLVNYYDRYVSTSTSAAERQKRWFFYGEDSWRVTPKLTVNYGLRWEIYFPESVNGKGNGGFANPVEGIIRVAGYGPYGLNGNIANNWHNFAPRLGVAYQFNDKTVVRMGYGRSFDMGVFGSNFGHAVTQNLPVLARQVVQPTNNGLPNANNSYVAAFNLSTGPPAFQPITVPSNGVLPLGGPQGNVQPHMRPTYQRLPTLDAWNVSVQRQVTANTSVTVAYVGNYAENMFAGNGPSYNLNTPAYGPGKAVVTTAGTAPGFTPTTPADQRRPYWNAFTTVYNGVPVVCCGAGIMDNYAGNDATGKYNALQISVNRRFTQGLQFQAYYTYSSAMNHSGDFGNYATAPQSTYGPDDFNRKHVFLWNAVYQLPFGKGRQFASNVGRAADLLIGGWQLSNTMNIASGLPWTPSLGECGQTVDTGPCVADRVGGFSVGAGKFDPATHTVTYFTPVSALTFPAASLTVGTDTCSLARPAAGGWALPACGRIGNAGRNSLWGPGHFMDDMSLAKDFHLTERFNLQFRTDAYNVFNHPVYGFSSTQGGGTCVDCGGNNGKITDIENGTTMRQLTFALKLQF